LRARIAQMSSVAFLWLVPDRRIENTLAAERQSAEG
jgi:hypothetical protein